jgi:hypothetical protein
MRKLIIALSLALLPGALTLEDAPDWARGYAPCPTEDSSACYWDAENMGNGEGMSFIVDSDGTVHYREG